MRFLCFEHSGVNFTPSMLSGNVLEWSKNTPLIESDWVVGLEGILFLILNQLGILVSRRLVKQVVERIIS